MTSSSLYPTKYLSEFFVPYNSFLETNILSTSKQCILNIFLFLQKLLLLIFYLQNLCSFHSFLYLAGKEM